MKVNRRVTLFDNESGERSYSLVNEYAGNACVSIGLSVDSGTVTVKGKVSEGSDAHPLGLINLETGEIVNEASEGIYSVLGTETLDSVIFTAAEPAVAAVKFVY